jgi:sugar lactone lactonase YvrE
MQRKILSIIFWGAILQSGVHALAEDNSPSFPTRPELFVDDPFEGCEGIAFNGEGRLFATCNRAFWEVRADGSVEKLADLESNLGVAGYGESDLLVADFGPTNAFRHDRNNDGVVWRISADGETRVAHARGIGDPNFILVLEDESYLVSDDATSDIYRVTRDGSVSLYTTAVKHPNGMVMSRDGKTLYVAQMFSNIRPVVGVNRLWAMRIQEGRPFRDARVVATTGPGSMPDGLTMDALGRVYIAANRERKIWRYDPESEETVLIAEGIPGAGSLVFGEGVFDRRSLYITSTFTGGEGGKIWRVPVGVEGAPVTR